MSATVDPKYRITLQGRDYVQVVGLVDAAHGAGLHSIETELAQAAAPDNGMRAVVRAIVTFEGGRVWSAYGDASPETTKLKAFERLAETRAIGRCLRFALNVADLAFEELPDTQEGNGHVAHQTPARSANGAAGGAPVVEPAPRRQPAVSAAVRPAGGAAVGNVSGPAGHCQIDGCGKPLTQTMVNRSQSRAQMNLCAAHLEEILAAK